MKAYYNEFKPEAAAMLRELIKQNLIAPGDVDVRSITEVTAEDIKGYSQCHFFAGIGGWSVALRLAGWPDNTPVWTGSCPCQPFSTAGIRKGKKDDRHLWPTWFKLIREIKPATIFGEQVNSAITFGWWDDVADDLENEGYACGAAVLPACSVGKPHKRDRLWFVGDSQYVRSYGPSIVGGNKTSIFNDTQGTNSSRQFTRTSDSGDVAHAKRIETQSSNPIGFHTESSHESFTSLKWVACPDGKSRPVKPGIRLLVDGFQYRVPILHGLGNAIVPQVAATFIKCYQEVKSENNERN